MRNRSASYVRVHCDWNNENEIEYSESQVHCILTQNSLSVPVYSVLSVSQKVGHKGLTLFISNANLH